MDNTWEQILFQLILHAGNARSAARQAVDLAEKNKWEEAEALLQKANEEQTQAHKINTTIITNAARGEAVDFSVLLVHALDLLILSWAEIDHADQYIRMAKRISKLEDEVMKNNNR